MNDLEEQRRGPNFSSRVALRRISHAFHVRPSGRRWFFLHIIKWSRPLPPGLHQLKIYPLIQLEEWSELFWTHVLLNASVYEWGHRHDKFRNPWLLPAPPSVWSPCAVARGVNLIEWSLTPRRRDGTAQKPKASRSPAHIRLGSPSMLRKEGSTLMATGDSICYRITKQDESDFLQKLQQFTVKICIAAPSACL